MTNSDLELIKKALRFNAEWVDEQNRGLLNYKKYDTQCAESGMDAGYMKTIVKVLEDGEDGNYYTMLDAVLFYMQSLRFILNNVSLEKSVIEQYNKDIESLKLIVKKLEDLTGIERDD